MAKRRKTIRQRIRLVAAGMLALLLVEGAVRVRQYVWHGTFSSTLFPTSIDPVTGLTLPVAGETTGAIRINSLGFRGPKIEVPPPAGTIRIGFLGTSETFCAEVSSNEATWPHLVWAGLQKHWATVPFDYVNGSVSGYGVEQSIVNLETRVGPTGPDVLVIYHGTSDMTHDTRRLAAEQRIWRGSAESSSWAARVSLTWFLIEKNLKVAARQWAASGSSGRLTFEPQQLSLRFRDRLRELTKKAQAVAQVVALVTISVQARRGQSPGEQLEACNTALFYAPYMTVDGLLDGWEEYNRVIRQVAKETGAILIEGEMSIPGDGVHFKDSVHFTDAGCKKMAARVVDGLTRSKKFEALMLGTPIAQRSPDER